MVKAGIGVLGSLPSPSRNAIHIGRLQIRAYGLAIALGILGERSVEVGFCDHRIPRRVIRVLPGEPSRPGVRSGWCPVSGDPGSMSRDIADQSMEDHADGPCWRCHQRGARLAELAPSPTRVPAAVEEEIVGLRKEVTDLGVDAGAHTIHAEAYEGRTHELQGADALVRRAVRIGNTAKGR